jgi:uncharacterized protein YdaU (DUF1376 family)
MKFYKRDPDRALAGMAELSLKQRGAYNGLLDLLYSRDGDVPDDDRRVAKMLSCHWREWATVKQELIALGKVWIEGGRLMAKRVQETLKEASDYGQRQSKIASERWTKSKKTNENNNPEMPSTATPIDTATPIVKETVKTSNSQPLPDLQSGLFGEEPKKTKPKPASKPAYPPAFEEFWKAYPTDPGMPKKPAFERWAKLSEDDQLRALRSIPAFKAWIPKQGRDYRTVWASTYLSERRFEGFTPLQVIDRDWAKYLEYSRDEKFWFSSCGPLPGEPGCLVPKELLQPGDGVGWQVGEKRA